MVETFRIAAYTRISVDLELNKDNTSIENQKDIIASYCKLHFPTSTVDYYEDRDRSGYTFAQRPGYMELRPKLMSRQYDILIVKDLSRFSRRTGKGLAEFEDMAENGIRIISIGEAVDYPIKSDDWLKIKLYFFVNEMPVTDASKKVISVINSRQSKGEWICSVPYGYVMTNSKKMTFEVDEPAAEVVREVFRLYTEGWGYKRIANHLTDKHIPTPRMREKMRKEAAGDEYRGRVKENWSIVTISEMLTNDFYIGTLRQHKYQRRKINGADMALDETEHIVFENNHPPIVDYRLFASARAQLKKRTTSCYRGVKKYDNTYSGFLFCGDCGSPMFALSRKNLAEAYTCGTYHVRGTAGCSSHHVRADLLDSVIKEYVAKLKTGSERMLAVLQESIGNEKNAIKDNADALADMQKLIDGEREELKSIIRQKARDLIRPGADSEVIEQTYDALIAESQNRIKGLENQLRMTSDGRNTVIRINRIAKTVMEIFDDIINKPKLKRTDLDLIIDRIIVYEDHIEIKLKSDIDELIRAGTLKTEDAANFKSDTENIESAAENMKTVAVQSAKNQRDKVFCVNVISGGEPLEIYTDKDGEVIFKKYSPIGDVGVFTGQYAEAINKISGIPVAICDNDTVVAVAGAPKHDLLEKAISQPLYEAMERRQNYSAAGEGGARLELTSGGSGVVSYMSPIVAEGNVIGAVMSLQNQKGAPPDDAEKKLISTGAMFLSSQMEI